MISTTDKGTHTEAVCLAELVKKGYRVAVPFGPARYDLIIDHGQTFSRAQCKTGRLRDGVVSFTASSHTTKHDHRPYDEGEIDLFLIYCPDTDKVYSLKVSEATSTAPHLRVDPPKNNQTVGVRWAKDYEI